VIKAPQPDYYDADSSDDSVEDKMKDAVARVYETTIVTANH